jgi:Cyclin, N-terminal domain
MVDLLERLNVMFMQEETVYKTEDYMDTNFQGLISSVCDPDYLGIGPSHSAESNGPSSLPGISDVWREKICEWSYQVIDHFDFSREVVSVSIHYLDRYLAKRPVNKKVFQLAAMTTLFLAIKLFEPGRLSMASMIELSRGYFTVEQMIAMEMSILR